MASFRHRSFASMLALFLVAAATDIAGAQDPGSARPADDGLLEGLFQTEVVNIGLEKLGYKVEKVKHLDIPSMTLAVGQGEPGETREVSDVVPRYLRHVKEA